MIYLGLQPWRDECAARAVAAVAAAAAKYLIHLPLIAVADPGSDTRVVLVKKNYVQYYKIQTKVRQT